MSNTKIIDTFGNPSETPIVELLEHLPSGVTLADLLATISTNTPTIELVEPPAVAPADALTGGIQTTISSTTTTISTATASISSTVPFSSVSNPYPVYS